MISFKGKAQIYYTPYTKFVEKVRYGAKEIGIPGKYGFADRVVSDLPMFTMDANTCSVLAVNDMMVHLAPEREEAYLVDKIADFLKEQKDKIGDLTAFLIGGKSRKIDGKSANLFMSIANQLEKFGADYSMICGKTMDLFMDHLYKDKNKFVFTQQYNEGLAEFAAQEEMTPDGFKDILKYYYDEVKISPKHEIIV